MLIILLIYNTFMLIILLIQYTLSNWFISRNHIAYDIYVNNHLIYINRLFEFNRNLVIVTWLNFAINYKKKKA